MSPTVQIISASGFIDVTMDRNYTTIGQYDNGVEALKVAAKYNPAIILLDYKMQLENTDIYIKTLLVESLETKVILLGQHLSDEVILSSLISGGFGYLDWSDVDNFLDKAIKFVNLGEAWVSRRLVGLLLEKIHD